MTRRHASTSVWLITAFSMLALAHSAGAQRNAATRDTLRLGDLQTEAVQRDPRARQLDLLATQSSLREGDVSATRLPTIGANAQGQYQSQVVTIPLQLPNGISVPVPSHDSYDAYLTAQQPLYDPSVSARRGVERAQLAVSQAAVRSSLFTLRAHPKWRRADPE